ncbi:MAG: hypothetical protein IT580_12340, partial [Verrucomicrobiales bacterium]|nr:hypothetical protein [Verrucomicrobiales bacterium]
MPPTPASPARSSAPPPPPLSVGQRPTGPAWSTPQRSGGASRAWLVFLLLVAVLGIGVAAVWFAARRIDFGGMASLGGSSHVQDDLKEVVVEDGSSRDKIALIDVGG